MESKKQKKTLLANLEEKKTIKKYLKVIKEQKSLETS